MTNERKTNVDDVVEILVVAAGRAKTAGYNDDPEAETDARDVAGLLLRIWTNLGCDADELFKSSPVATCSCGEWEIEEYGEFCPSCPESARHLG